MRVEALKRLKPVLIIGSIAMIVLVALVIFQSLPFFAMQADSIAHAGTWEDDPRNWYRAFHEEPPPEIKVVHSKYWRSNHFTFEFIDYFEIEAPVEWKDAFLKKRGLIQVSPSVARSFRTRIHGEGIPAWFAPDPVELYNVWDKPGYFGSVWINKSTGHIYFSDSQL